MGLPFTAEAPRQFPGSCRYERVTKVLTFVVPYTMRAALLPEPAEGLAISDVGTG